MTAYSYLRFSSPRQEWGDSQRRQAEKSVKYCERKQLHLDADLKFWDKGISGFHSKNLTEGALGRFLRAVKGGDGKPKTIKTPCILVVEALDRLSRDTLDEAFSLFLDLIRAGVEIHTLDPEVQYTRQSIKENPVHIMLAINDLWRANRESERRANLSKDNWQQKRRIAADKVMTRMVPHWLEAVEDVVETKPGADPVYMIRILPASSSASLPLPSGSGCFVPGRKQVFPAVACRSKGMPCFTQKSSTSSSCLSWSATRIK